MLEGGEEFFLLDYTENYLDGHRLAILPVAVNSSNSSRLCCCSFGVLILCVTASQKPAVTFVELNRHSHE